LQHHPYLIAPPSYGDVMGNGGQGQNFFTGGATGNMQGNDDPPPPYDMTTDDSFVPVYIRYGWTQPPPSAPATTTTTSFPVPPKN